MPVQPISFGLESRPGRFGPEGGARLVNAFAEQGAPEAKEPWLIYCRPGLTNFATLTGGAFRGAIDAGPVVYVVNGTQVDKVDSAGTVTTVGTFVGTGPVFMARNRKATPQIIMVSEGQRALIESDTVTTIADTDLPPPIGAAYIGGYFVCAIADGRYFWSSIDEGANWAALDFASAESDPDGLVGIIARSQEIILPGLKTIEFHALTGSSAVFERVPQTTLQLGVLTGAALKSLNGIPIFPASDGTVRMLSGYDPQRISTHDVERDIASIDDPDYITAGTFSLGGHQYYVLSSPSWTWVCDLLTRKWFQWESYGLDRWTAEGFVELEGKRLAGDYAAGKLYEISSDANDDAGEHLIWKLISGPTGAFPNPIIADELYLDIIPGVGLNSADAHESDPQVLLRTSDDDGKSWSDEISMSVGAIGDFKREVSFVNLGMSGEDGFRFEVAMSAPVSRCLQRASLRYTPLAN